MGAFPRERCDEWLGTGHHDFRGGRWEGITGKVCPGSLVPAVGMFHQHILRCKARGLATSCAQALFDACSTRNFLCFKNSRTSD